MITRTTWTNAASNVLEQALSQTILEIVRKEVADGISMLWHCKDDKHEAYCVTRLDGPPKEWCIVAFAGSGLMSFIKVFVEAAQRQQVPMRIHTVSPVLARIAKRWGFSDRPEFVLRRAA